MRISATFIKDTSLAPMNAKLTFCNQKAKAKAILNWYTLKYYSMGRKRLDRDSLHARVAPETTEKVKHIAFNLGFVYDGEGSIGQLLDAIASSEVVLISKKNFSKVVDTYSEVKV